MYSKYYECIPNEDKSGIILKMHKKNKVGELKPLGLLSTFVFVSLLIPFQAHSSDWVCTGTNSWSDAHCWLPNSVPGSGDSANILSSGSQNLTVNYTNVINPTATLSDIFINNTGTGSVVLNRSSNLSLNAGLMVLGTDGNVIVNHGVGDSIFDYVLMADQTSSYSEYNLSGTGTVTANVGIWLGENGHGVVNQSGGQLTTDELTLGSSSNGYGEYNLSDGVLTTVNEYVGFFGNANFNQTGGLHVVNDLHVGRKTGSGVYTLDAGTLTVNNALEIATIPAVPGVTTQNALFEQNGGTTTVTSEYGHIRTSATGMANAHYDLNGGTVNAPVVINNDTFEYSGGTLNADIENHDTLIINNSGTRTINGDLTNVGQSYFFHTFAAGTPEELTIDRTANGVIRLEDGTLVDVQGNLVLETHSILSIDLGSGYLSSDAQPWIAVTGDAWIAGSLDLTDLLDGSSLVENYYSWTLLNSSFIDGKFDEILFPVLTGWEWDVSYGANNIALEASYISGVPIPGSIWLFMSGLFGMIAVSRRVKGQ
ncbi:MAG: hypothetical protein OQL06_12555 [Gammaproteobacteria bacterium]|nr:hypothetical protein [Gammaproteobacteria bacterium]